ncbi:SRPBCC family protein [Candidatus Nitrosocosmicus arcticus]|uniref:Putative cyclase/dehydrase n=1 Tax=Candidatus Nitrosocosmicus arcticus TaxID=2035267 RepID=A0A557SU16_9ARCH|nr:SRPBCC family protein [Candidatus Nitrosocosmicus arcticus]TVP40097.1 putative cyclase/dehydrase [Candidatus Nitrosocosmicus arcticus]
MRSFEQSFMVNCHVDEVWNFYTDVKHLEIVTPPNLKLKIIETSDEQIVKGLQMTISGRLALYNSKWYSKISMVDVSKYEYIDEMVKGPFKKWKHVHLFSEIGKNQTVVTDKIEFELPFFFLGKLMEGYVENSLKKIFEYRKIQTVKNLSNKSVDE